MLILRKNDFSDSFSTLHDIEAAWKVSAIADSLAKTSPDKELIRELIEGSCVILGIDIASEDYRKYIDDVYANMVYINSQNSSDTIEEIKNLFGESLALAAINEASSSEISSKLEKNYKALGIDEDIYKKYEKCSDSQIKNKVQRLILKKGFKTADEIKEIFEDAVEEYIKDNANDSSSGSSGNSEGGGGGGGSKAGSAVGGFGAPVSSAVTDNISKPAASFKDCPDNHWAFGYIEELKSLNIISGYADGNFYPDKTVKREEFVKMIVLLSDIGNADDTCSFVDVSDSDWYYRYVASAYKAGIVNGVSDSRFGVEADISRQDVAVIVCRLLTKLGITTDENTTKTFVDSGEISVYAADSVKTLVAMSVLNGFEDGSFRPNASLTRAEAAKIISAVKLLIGK